MRRLAVLLAATLGIAAAVIVAVYLPAGPSDKEENEGLLRELPQFPDSEIVEFTANPYHNCGWPFRRRLGYNTAATYRAPAGVTAEQVIAFYMENLSGEWLATREDIGIISLEGPGQPGQALGSVPAARFVKGTATVHVSTHNMVAVGAVGAPDVRDARDFTVSVDSEGTVERPYCD